MTGTLFIVGTPIGNLKDITFRAIDVLKSVDIIACEDTRVSQTLLNAYDIKKPLVSYYKHKEREGTQLLVGELLSGKNVALITDAGMPAVSDPGAVLVETCHKNEIKVSIVPGPTALASAVALSGIQSQGFTFLGFLPEKTKDKDELVSPFKFSKLPLVFYSSPHGINDDAKFLFSVLGGRKAYGIKEITKLFEGMVVLNLEDFYIENPRGEYVLIIEGQTGENPLNELSVKQHVMHYMKSGMLKKDAIKRTASDMNVDKNTIYVETLDL